MVTKLIEPKDNILLLRKVVKGGWELRRFVMIPEGDGALYQREKIIRIKAKEAVNGKYFTRTN